MSYISLHDTLGKFGRAAPLLEEDEVSAALPARALAAPPPPVRFMAAKRGFDIVMALALLPVVGFSCLFVVALNPFLNPGSLFFVQTRVGKNGKPFRMVKLRTMIGKAAAARLDHDESDRITRFGRFLRAKRIDELPQALNIVRGQMSFIGPRPEQIELYREIVAMLPEYGARQMVRPGISGLAQVQSGYARDRQELRAKLRYDMAYIRGMSPSMEFYVLARTLRVVVTGFGAR